MENKKDDKFNNINDSGSVGIVKISYFDFANPSDEFVLSNGSKLSPVTIAYETYGTLNSDKSNAILIFHALSGDAHAAGYNSADEKKPGWWDIMIGPGKPFDTDKYFVICSNIIGGCKGSTGPSSINPKTGKPYGITFPIISIKDMIIPQKKLLDYFGIKKLFCAAGGSMGGMQLLQWLVSYPDFTEGAMIIATSPTHTAQAIAFNSVGRYAIIVDPNWNNGNYYGSEKPDKGLSIARMIGHITYLSEESMHRKFGRKIINGKIFQADIADFTKEFEVENYLQYQGESFIKRFDANSYLYISKAIDDFDITDGFENLTDAFKKIKAKCFVMSFTSDWLYPKEQSMKIVKALKINGIETTYTNFEAPYGHDSFLIDDDRLKRLFAGFLKSLEEHIQ
ncbi:MAG: homoserine O-acetyltransferase [Actinobacteria bacterium]|nr:homoserine O-acetyltransferase [Actinomycetota bacterium]